MKSCEPLITSNESGYNFTLVQEKSRIGNAWLG